MSTIKGRYVTVKPKGRMEHSSNVHTEIYDSTTEATFGILPAPSAFQLSPFNDMTENELKKELRKHINELREAHRRGRL